MRKNKQFKIKLFKKNIYIFTKKKRKRNLLFAYLHIEESYRIQTKQTTFREKETSISKNILCTVYFHFSKTDNDVSSLIETRLIRPFRATQVERILSAQRFCALPRARRKLSSLFQSGWRISFITFEFYRFPRSLYRLFRPPALLAELTSFARWIGAAENE